MGRLTAAKYPTSYAPGPKSLIRPLCLPPLSFREGCTNIESKHVTSVINNRLENLRSLCYKSGISLVSSCHSKQTNFSDLGNVTPGCGGRQGHGSELLGTLPLSWEGTYEI